MHFSVAICSDLTTVTIENGVTDICYGAFYASNRLESVTISDGVTNIGDKAFSNCINLTDVVLPEGLTSIQSNVFYECKALKNINIPNSVTSIGENAFSYCGSLKRMVIPNGVTSIDSCAFLCCQNLQSIWIPDSVTNIGSDSFMFCNVTSGECFAPFYYSKGNYYDGRHEEITIRFEGTEEQWNNAVGSNRVGYETIYFNYFSVDADFKLSQTSYTYTGSARKPSVTVTYKGNKLVEGTDYTLTYKKNVNAGTATVNVNGNGEYSGTAPIKFTITPCTISNSRITISGISAKTYTGKALTQAVVVKDGNKTLTSGTDYKVTYKNNTNAGTATVTIKGIGNYTGSVNKTFTIKKAANKITASNFTRSYSASAQNITIGAKATGGTLKYTSNNTKVKVTSAGKVTLPAKFTGTVKITITAENSNYNKATKTISITVPSKTALSGGSSPAAGKMKVVWNKNTAVTGYQIQYSLKSDFSSKKTVTISKNTQTSKTITGLTKRKKYYVRIRSFKTVSGTKYYSAWSTSKATTIKK